MRAEPSIVESESKTTNKISWANKANQAASKTEQAHKATRESKRSVKPAARGLAGSLRGSAPQSWKQTKKRHTKLFGRTKHQRKESKTIDQRAGNSPEIRWVHKISTYAVLLERDELPALFQPNSDSVFGGRGAVQRKRTANYLLHVIRRRNSVLCESVQSKQQFGIRTPKI